MNIHKKARLTPVQRKEVYEKYHKEEISISELSRSYHVSRPTIMKILKRGRGKDFSLHKSINKRYRCLSYGMKRLAKIEKTIEERLKNQAKRYNKSYPGEMIHVDTKRLPLLKGETPDMKREYLYVGIDDYSRELFCSILPDKSQVSSKAFGEQLLEECSYTIERIYSDNGREFKGTESHEFVNLLRENEIKQRFTKVRTPRTNGKAERVIRTLMEMWHTKTVFSSRAHRKTELIRFVNYYNTVKPHKGIDGKTPMEQLLTYFYPTNL